jgi:ankyrin repeat protein
VFAVRANALESIKVLLDAGSDVNKTMADGTSAMVIAIINGHYKLARFLLDIGADPNVADLRGEPHSTPPLICAIIAGLKFRSLPVMIPILWI